MSLIALALLLSAPRHCRQPLLLLPRDYCRGAATYPAGSSGSFPVRSAEGNAEGNTGSRTQSSTRVAGGGASWRYHHPNSRYVRTAIWQRPLQFPLSAATRTRHTTSIQLCARCRKGTRLACVGASASASAYTSLSAAITATAIRSAAANAPAVIRGGVISVAGRLTVGEGHISTFSFSSTVLISTDQNKRYQSLRRLVVQESAHTRETSQQ